MRLKITYDYTMAYDNFHQKAIFWEGSSKNIKKIPNPFVQELAKKAVSKKKNQKRGIWKIKLLKKKK